MLKRRLKLLGKILLGFIVLLAAFLLFERFRGQIALSSYKKALIAKGEKMSPQDFSPRPSEADNGAPPAFAAIERLQRGVVLPHNYPPRLRLVPSGRAIVGFRESEWVEKGTYRNDEWTNQRVTNNWQLLTADLQTNQPILAEIRAALEKPELNNQLNLSAGTKLKFAHLAPAKSLTYWFGSASQLALREGRNHDAAAFLVSQICLPRLLAEDRLLISELVRNAIGAFARTDTWEALQTDGWTEEDLVAVQKAWESQEFAAAMARSLEGERFFCSQSIEQLRASNEETYQLMFVFSGMVTAIFGGEVSEESWSERLWERLPYGEELREFTRKQIYCRIWRFAWSHQAQLRDLKNMQRLIELMRQGANDRSYTDIESAIDQLLAGASRAGLYDRLRFPEPDSLGAMAKAVLKAMKLETDRSLALCAIALKRHSLGRANLPARLDALVPELLPSVPVDYMDGKPIKYRLNAEGGFALYSVGEDGKDDGGDLTLPDGSKSKELWLRRDYVWPAPATPEEVEEFRRESAKD